jgi:hypothetical protein
LFRPKESITNPTKESTLHELFEVLIINLNPFWELTSI